MRCLILARRGEVKFQVISLGVEHIDGLPCASLNRPAALDKRLNRRARHHPLQPGA